MRTELVRVERSVLNLYRKASRRTGVPLTRLVSDALRKNLKVVPVKVGVIRVK